MATIGADAPRFRQGKVHETLSLEILRLDAHHSIALAAHMIGTMTTDRGDHA
jgi:hypothetical protein